MKKCLFLIVPLLLLAGCFQKTAVVKEQPKKLSDAPATNQQTTSSTTATNPGAGNPIATTTPKEPENLWKTYSNDVYSFSLKYPKELNMHEDSVDTAKYPDAYPQFTLTLGTNSDPTQIAFRGDKDVQIRVTVDTHPALDAKTKLTSLDQFKSTLDATFQKYVSDVTLAGQKALLIDTSGSKDPRTGPVTSLSYIILHNGSEYTISIVPANSQYSTYTKDMIGSFKFTK